MKYIITESQLKTIMEDIESSKLEDFKQELQSIGEPMTDQEIKELQPGCSLSDDFPEYSEVISKVETAADNMTVSDIKNKIKELKKLRKDAKLQEQMSGINIGGSVIPGNIVLAVSGVLILILIIKLFKRIFGGTMQSPECRKKNRLFRRFGPAGVV